MILLVSHYSSNKGTTDYFREFLKKRAITHYYLKHPIRHNNIDVSEFILFDGDKEIIIKKFKSYSFFIFELIKDFIVSLSISFQYNKKITSVWCFGGFNVIPFIIFKYLFRRKLFFWGVDYSPKRFGNLLMDKVYYLFETISCKKSDFIISPNERQENIRIKKHGLIKKKSLIIPNGVIETSVINQKLNIIKPALLYMGSLSPNHGVINFVEYFYVHKRINLPLYIFGGGSLEKQLLEIINSNNIFDLVHYYGYKTSSEIDLFVRDCCEQLFGIAPYLVNRHNHIYYADSLKLKEYINYGLPFIVTDGLCISKDLEKYGFIYSNFKDLEKFFENIDSYKFDNTKARKAIIKYRWNIILEKLIPYIKE